MSRHTPFSKPKVIEVGGRAYRVQMRYDRGTGTLEGAYDIVMNRYGYFDPLTGEYRPDRRRVDAPHNEA